MRIFYKKGYKYQLWKRYVISLPIYPEEACATPYVILTTAGVLHVKEGYAWDGPSGPTFDTKTLMRGSLVHDALYQLIRLGKLPPSAKQLADRVLHDICIEDGMWPLRADWVLAGVRFGGEHSIQPEAEPPVLEAP